MKTHNFANWRRLPALALAGLTLFHAAATAPALRAEVIEEIVAQVNDKVIVLSEYKRSLDSIRGELQQQGASGLDLESRFKEQSANALRELIDQQLLIQKAKIGRAHV